jgi:hypothetical protein
MAEVLVVDPVMSQTELERLVAATERFPVYSRSGAGSFARKRRRREARSAAMKNGPGAAGAAAASAEPKRRFAPGLEQRVDAGLNYVRQGGLRRQPDDPLLQFRNRYFRETLHHADAVYAPGMEQYLANPRLAEAARRVFGHEVVVPWNVYANVMLPGQELGMHTDIPEFRGAHRDFLPGWFLCAMHVSGLFEPWRVKIATAVTYLFGDEGGGMFLCYPDGPDGPPACFPATHNTAIVADTDSIFHGVERVPGETDALMLVDVNTRLVPKAGGRWSLRCGEPGRLEEVATFSREELRFSLSWKGYCFADEHDREARTASPDALDLETILTVLVDELVARGRLPGPEHGLSEEELGLLFIDEFLHFPEVTPIEPVAAATGPHPEPG